MLRTLLFLTLLTGIAAADDCLVLIEADYRDVAQAPWMRGVTVARIAEDYLIVVCDAAALGSLPSAQVLDCTDPAGLGFVNVWTITPAGHARAKLLGTVVFTRGDYLLVRREGDLPAGFTLEGIRAVTPLFPHEQRAEAAPSAPTTGRDPIVAGIAAAVDEAEFQGAIQDLEDLQTRNARTTAFARACSDVSAAFSAYGLDVQLQEYTAEPWYGEEFTCWNVIGEMVGSEHPEQVYIICGHLDSTAGQPWQAEPLAPGADDNASGSSVVLEAARVMAGLDFRYTLRFVCFGAEEQGLCGSTYYAEGAAAAGEDILGVINIDMILYAPPGSETLRVNYDTQSEALALALEAAAATYIPELDVDIRYSPGSAYSDHYPFWQNGYAAVQACERDLSSNPYYHTTDDRLINYMSYFPFGTRCAAAAIAGLATLAEPLGGSAVESEPIAAAVDLLAVHVQPNPTRGSTRVVFSAPIAGTYEVSVHDLLGRALHRSSSGVERPGAIAIDLALGSFSPGVYLVRTSGVGHESVRQLILAP